MVKKGFAGIFIIGLLLAGFFLFPDSPPFLIGGIQINEPDMEAWTSTVQEAGMNTVEVTVYAKNGDWDSQWMKFEDEEPYVLAEIRAAKARNLKVVLILRQALDHYYPRNKFLWHGMIFPVEATALDIWFNTYHDFVNKWAEVAEQEGVDVLVIGSELNALAATMPTDTVPATIDWFADSARLRLWEERVLKYESDISQKDLWVRGFPNYADPRAYIRDKVAIHREWAQEVGFFKEGSPSLDLINARRAHLLEKWHAAIKGARKRFAGKLSFAANFDNYQEVAFWDELDFIGINAYFPLREPSRTVEYKLPKAEQLQAAWLDILAEIDTFRYAHNLQDKPVIFTELGYTYRNNCTLRPWQGHGFSVVGDGRREQLIVWPEQPLNRRERVLAVDALYAAVTETGFPLAGILYWKLSGQPEMVEIEPFGLHISGNPTDSLQAALARFSALPGHGW